MYKFSKHFDVGHLHIMQDTGVQAAMQDTGVQAAEDAERDLGAKMQSLRSGANK